MICELTTGSIVISKKGRDKGEWFVVVKVVQDTQSKRDSTYVWLVNGTTRMVERPKKKKRKHVKLTKYFDATIKDRIQNGINNSEVRKAIMQYAHSEK